MANVKISDIFAASPAAKVNDADQFEINQAGSTAACTAEQIRGNFSRVDISAGNQTQAIAAATGSGDIYRVEWYGGTIAAGFTFEFTGVANLTFGNTLVTVANSAGEGTGHIVIKDVGSSVWLVLEYEDESVETGDVTGGTIRKTISEMVISHMTTTTYTTSSGTGTIFRNGTVVAFTFPKTFATAPDVTPMSEHASGAPNWGSQVVAPTTTTWSGYLISATNTSQGKFGYTARGDWF